MVDISKNMKAKYYSKHFDDEKLIGSGAFSSVFKAKRLNTGEYFAIKKIALKLEEENRVNTELQILTKLDSIYVIKLIDHWIEENYYPNNDLYKSEDCGLSIDNKILTEDMSHLLHIQTHIYPLTLRNVMIQLNESELDSNTNLLSIKGYFIAGLLFTELLKGVKYLHECNVIHRDLKPENVLISNGDSGSYIKICDFGLATKHELEKQSHTLSVGTQQYVAPEVWITSKYDTKADIYSLGVILEEIFHIDYNNTAVESSQTLLDQYYTNLYELCPLLTHTRVEKRLSCDKVLLKLNSFFVCLQEFELTKEYDAISIEPILPDSDLERKFIEFILQKTKLSL